MLSQVKSKVINPSNDTLSNLRKDLDEHKPTQDATAQEVSAYTLAMVSALSTMEKVAKNVSILTLVCKPSSNISPLNVS